MVNNKIKLLLQSALLYYLLDMFYFKTDFGLLIRLSHSRGERAVGRDKELRPLATHKLHLPQPDTRIYFLHKTHSNMSDFLDFVENESTNVIEEYQFYLQNYNSTKKHKDKFQFKPGHSYSKSEVRRFLTEYYIARISWFRNPSNMKDDPPRFWYAAKAVKDYILITGKKEFSYKEIENLIESKAILNYMNDLIQWLLDTFTIIVDTKMCDDPDSRCG